MKFYNQKLLKYRKRERLSCSKLCEIIGIGRTTYWKWESGSAIPEENFIRLLAKALNVSVSELSDLEPEQPISEINYSETIKSWLSFLDVEFESFQQKSINDALQKILSLNQELLKASVVIRALLKATTSIIYVKDKELKYMTANDAFLKNASLNSGFKVLNMTDEDFFTLSEAKLNHDEDRRVLQTGIPVTGAERHIPGSRRKKWGYISKQPIFDNNNKISGIIGSFTDITKLKELEGKRMILENAVNNLDSYIWIAKYNPETDKKVQVVYLSKSIINLYKKITHSTSIPSGISINNEICKEFNSEHYEYIRTLILSQKGIFPLNREFMEFSRSHNKKRFFYERIVNYEQHYYFGILEDITDQKNTEKNLKLLDISIDSMTDGVGIYDIQQDKYIYLNKALEKISGHPLDNFLTHGRNYWLNKCVHPDDREGQKSFLQNKNWPLTREYRLVTPDGKIKWVEARTFPRKQTPASDTIITIIRDISKEKQQREEHELLDIHINEMPSGIIIMDIDNTENIYLNKTAGHIFGYEPENFYGKNGYRFWLEKCVHPDDKKEQYNYFKNKKWPQRRQYRIIRPNGEIRYIEAKNTQFHKFKNRQCYISIINDITDTVRHMEIFNLLEKCIENSVDCLSIRQHNPLKIIYISKSCESIFGYKQRVFINNPRFRVEKCVHPDNREKELLYVKKGINRPPIRNYKILTPTGQEKLIEESTFHFALNNRDYLCGISRDITQSKNQQKAVKEREKEIAIQMKKNGIPEDIIESCTGIPKSIIKDLDVLGEYI